MIKTSTVFNFEYIPLGISRSSIKVFRNAKDAFSLEYAVSEPKTVRINMYPVKRGWFRKIKVDRGLATIRQFASALGLHPDFHRISPAPIRLILNLLKIPVVLLTIVEAYWQLMGTKTKWLHQIMVSLTIFWRFYLKIPSLLLYNSFFSQLNFLKNFK
ncbi:MAG: hypothetical protein ACFE9L_17340 [Candidatus Hodarchaeota archaeon]